MNRSMTHQLKNSRVFIASLLALMTLISAIAFVSAGSRPATTAGVDVNKPAMEKPGSNLLDPPAALVPAPISGTKSVCPSGCDYPTLTTAIADIQAQGLNGALTLELASTYVSSSETFPITFTNLTGSTAVNTVTVRPASGATNLTITSANTTATIDLNNANFLTIDGRAGGVGLNKDLTIENTATAGVTLRFINEASNNNFKYTVLKGVTNDTLRGLVLFSTTTGPNGNDNNTIDNCDIRDSVSTPAIAVYSSGSSTTPAQNNSGNTISNCSIFNFYIAANFAAGVRLVGGNTDWTITGNSFYQTATRTATSGSVFGILIENPTGNNLSVTNNFFGGSGPGATGAAWTTTGTTASNRFVGIQMNVSTTTPSSVQGNTIKNFVWTSASNFTVPPGAWTGINIVAGSVNIGTVAGNTIGNGTGTGSVSVTTSANGDATFGIAAGGAGSRVISNNTIGSITTNGTTTEISGSLFGIQVGAGTNTISNNTIGSLTTANSLNAATSSTSIVAQQVTGILSLSSVGATITGNTIANLNNNYDGTAAAGQIRGIITSNGANTITSNTVRNLATSSRNSNSASAHSVFGITQTSTTAGQTISQNVVHSLSNTAAASGVSVTGIYYAGNTSNGTNLIARNLVHSLSVSSTSGSSSATGIYFANGTFTAQNNMVRLGIGSSGMPTAGASRVFGLLDLGNAENRNFYHNSVYIGGTHTSGTSGSAPFAASNSNNARIIKNNIFVNVRANNGGTGPQYAVVYGDFTGAPPTGITSDNNIFYSNGSGVFFGLYNGIEQATLQAWRNASGLDASSSFIDPLFINPTGGTPDLHLQPSNPAESGGTAIAGVPDDFDGEVRSALTPTDIGADAGNFSSSSGDIYAPVISYTLLTKGSTANRTLTGFATIVDNSGVVSSGANSPRLYFKKSTDADAFVGNTSTNNGWKFVTATNSTSPYSFVIDYSILFNSGGGSGSVAAGDTIQYFVVAQDIASNLSSNPAGAGNAANPPVQNVNAKPGLVNSYLIAVSISGTKTVCAAGPPSCDYVNLTGASGIFADINSNIVTGNLVINISGDLTETGTNGLNHLAEDGAGGYSVTIQPDPAGTATMKTISGNVANGMIRLNGADRVTIDGRFQNAGRFLTFRNSNTSNPTITLLNDASNNVIRSSIIEGAAFNNSNGVLWFSGGVTTGNDDNLITDNQIRDRSDGQGLPHNLVLSQGSSATVANTGNTISNNELFNFNFSSVYLATGNESWTISGNNIYELSPRTGVFLHAILVEGGTNLVTQNLIHDLLMISGTATGISVSSPGITTVSQNRIYSLPGTSGSPTYQGIVFNSGGTINVLNNQISIIPSGTTNQVIRGIVDNGANGSTFNAYFNSVLIGGTANGTSSTWACLRSTGVASTHTSHNNICFNNRTNNPGGTGNHFAAGNQSAFGSFTSNYNLFVGTGTTAVNFMDSSASSSGSPVSFATWQSSTGGDANSQAGNPGGDFTSAMFRNPAVGNLGIVATGNPLVSNTGTPVPGITTDYDNETRSATTPDIGSDEFNSSVLDTTPPIVTSIDDGDVDNSVSLNTIMTYTVVFDEDIDAATVTAADFANAGTATITIGSIMETSLGVFSVQVTPTTAGTVILHIPAGAVINDLTGNPLNTPVSDNDTVTVLPNMTVNTLGDAADVALDGNCDTDAATAGSQCTLRAAIQETNNRPSDDSIDFSLPPNSTITLNTALDAINGNLAINGPGPNLLTIQRSTAGGTPDFRIFAINSGRTVTISGLTISNGRLTALEEFGAGVRNHGTLTMTECNVYGNSMLNVVGGNGGGIYSVGSLTLNNCIFGGLAVGQPNTSTGGGGGVFSGGTLMMTGGSIVGNSGSGISLTGTATLDRVTIANNSTSTNPTTSAGVTVFTDGKITISNSLIANNNSENGRGGGGILNTNSVTTLLNTTVSGNTTRGSGGGIDNFNATMTLINVTVTNNRANSDNIGSGASGGGIQASGGNPLLINSIVVNNSYGSSSSPTASDVSFAVSSSSSFNLIGVCDLCGLTNGTNNNIVGVTNPGLAPLANNGGPTLTQALLAGSPALDAGSNSFVTNPPFNGPPFTDQRGTGFNRIVDAPDADITATVDIGAYERQAVFTNLTDATTNEDTPIIIPFEIDDSASITSVTATSSNTSLVPNNPANIMVTNTGSTWLLTINPAANLSGVSEITVTVNRTGGSTNRTFTLTVNPVNDAPSFTKGPDQTVAEDSGAQVVPGWATSISAGSQDESAQTVTFQVTGNTNPGLFSVGPAISSTGTLTYTPAANANGSATITVRLTDNGGGADTSPSQPFNINIFPVADTPSVTSATTNANTQTTSGLVISRNPADGAEVTHFKITGITGGSLFKSNGTTPINNGDFITFAEGNAGLKFTPGTTNGSFSVQASTSASDAGLGGGTATAVITVNPLSVIRFSEGFHNVAEGAGFGTITVERSGDTSQGVTVDYASSDHSNPADFIPCTSLGAGFASSRCDFTTAIGTLRFAAGETTKTFNVLISQDNYVEGPETLELTLSNPTGGAVFGVPQTATLSIIDDATEPSTNQVDVSSEFVRSQYHDFLNREPDAPGLAFWTDNIEKCNDPDRRPPGQTVAQCIDKQRESTAVAFFMSPEFQITGGFVYHLYKGSLTGSPNYDGGSAGRFPTSLEFMRDVATVSEGIVVNNAISGAVVEANRNRLAEEFVLRPEFLAKYGGLNNTLYVQELFNTTGIAATAAEKQALVDGLTAGSETRASVLRKVVDGTVVVSEGNVQFTTTYGQAFINQENSRVFVFMEYVGYLRRNPDQAGYVFWLGKLNTFGGDPFAAEMVRSFILAPEYRQRFGQ
jgi:hypothetical protein